MLLVFFAFIALVSRKEQSALLASVLLVVGLGLPIVYFGMYWSQVNVQVERQKLKDQPLVYHVTLNRNGIHVRNARKEEEADFPWETMHAAYRVRGCIYLYVTPGKAFLLPHGQADTSDQNVWKMIEEHMPGKARSHVRDRNA